MKFVKNKILKFSIILTLLFSVSASNAGIFSWVPNFLNIGGQVTTVLAFRQLSPIVFGMVESLPEKQKSLVYSGIFVAFVAIMAYTQILDMRASKIDFSPKSKNNVLRYWFLDWAFKLNQIKILKYLFNEKNCPEIDAEYSLGYRPVDYACKYNNVEILRWLIDVRGARVEKNETETMGEGGGYTPVYVRTGKCAPTKKYPIQIAVQNNSFEAFKFLASRISIEETLRYVFNLGSDEEFEILKYLIENGFCGVNSGVNYNLTPDNDPEHLIYYAAENCDAKLVKYLVDNGADFDINRFDHYRTFAERDNSKNHENIKKYLRLADKNKKDLCSKILDLIDYLEITNNAPKKDTSVKINDIKKLFNNADTPLYAKQSALTSLVELHKFKSDLIKFDDIKQLYKKIEFNYTFVNELGFKSAVIFALESHEEINGLEKTKIEHNFRDINDKSILDAIAMYDKNQNYLEYTFENKGDLYDNPDLIKKVLANKLDPRPGIIVAFKNAFTKTKNSLFNLKNKISNTVSAIFGSERAYDINQDYSDTWDNLKKNGKKEQLKKFIHRPIVMHDLNKIKSTYVNGDKQDMPDSVVGKIIGYGV